MRRTGGVNDEQRAYSPIQKDEVERILKYKENYYKVLNSEKGATKEQLERSYKKISVKIHPDKNSHPKAEDAFKILNEAKQCLLDDQSRYIYDATGKNPTNNRPTYRPQPVDPFSFFFAQGLDPRMFRTAHSHGGQQFHYTFRPRTTQTQAPRQHVENELFYISILFLVMIGVMLFISNMMVVDSPFEFQKIGDYTIERESKNGVKYYVKYRNQKTNLDSEVDGKWYQILKEQCYEEDDSNYRFRKLERNYMERNNAELSRKYKEKLTSVSCDAFNAFHKKLVSASAA